MERELLLGIHWGTQSLTPATQDTPSLASLPEDVSLMENGLGISLYVRVSALVLNWIVYACKNRSRLGDGARNDTL